MLNLFVKSELSPIQGIIRDPKILKSIKFTVVSGLTSTFVSFYYKCNIFLLFKNLWEIIDMTFGSKLAKLSTDQIYTHFGSTSFLIFENFCNFKEEKSHHYFEILIANIISRKYARIMQWSCLRPGPRARDAIINFFKN